MKTIFTLTLLFLIFLEPKAQQTFLKVVHTDSITNASTPSIKPTIDGGFIYSQGYVKKLPNRTAVTQAKLAKFNKAGEVQWMRTLIGVGHPVAFQLEDSSFILSGIGGAITLLKTDKAGNTLWQKTYSNIGETVTSTVRASNGFIYFLYGSYSGTGIVKINAQTGAYVMERIYAFSDLSKHWYGTALYETSDKGFIVCGYNISYPGDEDNKFHLLKVDSLLNLQWSKVFYKKHVDSIYKEATPYSVVESLDKGYVIAGWSRAPRNANNQRADILKVDNQGNPVWHKQYSSDSASYIWDITKNADSTFTMVGYSGSCGYPCRFGPTITEIDANGSVIWSGVSKQAGLLFGVIKSISKTFTAVGNIGILDGGSQLLRFTNNGESCAGMKNNKFAVNDVIDSVVSNVFTVTTPYKKVVTNLDPGTNTIVTPDVRISCTTSIAKNVVENSVVNVFDDFSAVMYPNPAKGKLAQLKINSSLLQKIELTAFNAEGKMLIRQSVLLDTGNNTIQLDISMLNEGVYFIKLDTKKNRKVIQFIKTN